MRLIKYILIILWAPALQAAGLINHGLVFEAIISPIEWNKANYESQISISWKVKNITNKAVILPVGTQTRLEILDEFGKSISGGISRNALMAFTAADYLTIKSGNEVIFSAGNYVFSKTDRQIYIKAKEVRGGEIKYGPLLSGKYKIRCMFFTELEPSEYAKNKIELSKLWFGDLSSSWSDIKIRVN